MTDQDTPKTDNLIEPVETPSTPSDIEKELNERLDAIESRLADDSEEDKPATLVWIGTALAFVAWIGMFVFDKFISNTTVLLCVVLAAAIGSMVLCIKGRKRAPLIAPISVIIAISLMVFAITCLIILAVSE